MYSEVDAGNKLPSGMPQTLRSLYCARPGKVVVDAGDTEIRFPAERLAQVMHRVREGAEELDDGEDEKCLIVWYDPERASTPEKSARSALRGDQ